MALILSLVCLVSFGVSLGQFPMLYISLITILPACATKYVISVRERQVYDHSTFTIEFVLLQLCIGFPFDTIHF